MFSNGIINVTRIYSVDRVVARESSKGKTVSYPSNLPTYELVFFVKGGSLTTFCGKEIKDEQGSIRFLPKGAGNGGYTVTDAVTGSEIKWEASGYVNKSAIQYVIKEAN